mmetsp:Transcript_35781/g.78111  ORF Transcript_35781/g.78111 Transcript_35781/m.78111 type:complete len:447 (-) Transcript_35781:198-1538(-)|eukprot:CAMPEP_0118932188 /NCGR_PEP_ID=MMETSP1169-20130426/9423_1 /TAXON_ID=36882 /ORGANISM="Pyramimonas obovata, Strain CCMP722" /LENGTH=446 /DNA_ID=CAMNT_0006874807 /DNA_START=79 /DNA_END=1419 /DNA_ORIENTATION=+
MAMSTVSSKVACNVRTQFGASSRGASALKAPVATKATHRPGVAMCSAGETMHEMSRAVRNAGLGLAMAAAVSMPLAPIAQAFEPQPVYGDMALLTAGDPVKNSKALLRNALPINNKEIRTIQLALESIAEDLRVPGVRFSGVAKSVNNSYNIATKQADKILKSVPAANKEEAASLLTQLQNGLGEFKIIVDNKDKQQVPIKQQELLQIVGLIEECMVDGFPFEVPAEYADKPLLKGRATVEMTVNYKDNPRTKRETMTIVVDGLNAPVTAGNFVDLVARNFYDNMEINRSDGFVVQTGDPKGSAIGYVDPSTKQLRTIPLEVKIPKDKIPVYEETLEDIGRFNETPALPFNAYGTLAMARTEFETNSASSQIFWLLKESELTPSGANLLDGRYSVFGYVTENVDALGEMHVGDVIESVKVVSGMEFLENFKAPVRIPPLAEEAQAL